MNKLIYVCDPDSGGIVEYALRQVTAFERSAVSVLFLCPASFPTNRLPAGVRVEILPSSQPGAMQSGLGISGKLARMRAMIGDSMNQAAVVAAIAEREGGAGNVCVLFSCYKEYFAPLWVWPLRRLARKGIAIGTIAHDPVRDFVVGPRWWHRWSVRMGYSFVRDVFVHDDTPVDFGGGKPEHLRVHRILHGPFEISAPKIGRGAMRVRYGFEESDMVFLAFGQIRDGKNLDLFLNAMTKLSKRVKLLVAGEGVSGSSKPPAFYQALARELGVAERCVWDIRRIPDEEVGNVFTACDVVLLTYSAKFRSASGVLNAAASARKPVLASSGPGPLKTAVQQYGLGQWIEPDNLEAMVAGVDRWKSTPPQPEWARYLRDHSWDENAARVLDALQQPSHPR